MKLLRHAWLGCRWCASGLGTLVLWTAWLGLSLLLAVQAYVASRSQLEVPGFVLRSLEQRLETSGVHARFGRTRFDPSGRVLIEDVAVTMPGFEEHVATARAVYARLDPLALAEGRFDPVELRVTGAALRIPALLSPSGKADEIVSDLDAALYPSGEELRIGYLTFRLGPMEVAARGALHLGGAAGTRTPPLPVADFLARNYARLMREFADAVDTLAALDHPVLQATLSPAPDRGAVADVTLAARGLALESPVRVRSSALRLGFSLPFPLPAGKPVEAAVSFSTGELDLPRAVVARGVHARLKVRLPPDRLRFGLDAVEGADVDAAEVAAEGVTVGAPMASLAPGPGRSVQGTVRGAIFGAPMSVSGEADLGARTAGVRFEGALAPGLLDPAGARAGRDLHRYLGFAAPVGVEGEARFGPGWAFQGVDGRVDAHDVTVVRVKLDEARGRFAFDGRRLTAPEAYVRIGDDWARGSYAETLATRDYRFLLEGRLRPLDIAGWFRPGTFWHVFFAKANFEFPDAPPFANADVQGRWTDRRKAEIFVAVDSVAPVVRGVRLDEAGGRLFIRPNFEDAFEFHARKGAGVASGTFTRRYDLDKAAMESVDFDAVSTLDPALPAAIYGPKGVAILEPFGFDRPPSVKASGRIEGAAAPGGPHTTLHMEVRSDGPFRYREFPFDRASFTADVRDAEISVADVKAGFAGGTVTGKAKVWGSGVGRRLGFDAAITNASLGPAITTVEAFVSRRANRAPPPPSSFLKGKSSVRVDVAASAEGAFGDALSFKGNGNALVRGAELGEVRMLGQLSTLLPFTSLRFTSARADFKIEGPKLEFPDIVVTGANSKIQARGAYALDRHQLDINAKLFPFDESKTLPQQVVGLLLTPFSQFLEVRLTGSLEDFHWSFVNAPTNLLRNLSAPGK
jgi:hypothetical protein